jgi:hypothetical protein
LAPERQTRPDSGSCRRVGVRSLDATEVVMIAYDRKTALIAVDVQNDFAYENGSLYVGEGEAGGRVE